MTINSDEAVLRFRNFRAVHGTVGVHASNLVPVSVRQNRSITLTECRFQGPRQPRAKRAKLQQICI